MILTANTGLFRLGHMCQQNINKLATKLLLMESVIIIV